MSRPCSGPPGPPDLPNFRKCIPGIVLQLWYKWCRVSNTGVKLTSNFIIFSSNLCTARIVPGVLLVPICQVEHIIISFTISTMSKIVKRFIKPSGSERIAADSNAESTSSASDSAVETVAAGKPIYSSFPTRFSFESLRSKQENWLTNGGRNIWFKALEFQLLKHDMSHHTMEIINNSHGPLFESASCLNASSGSSASDSDTDTATDASGRWTVEWMCRWLTTLKCFDVCSSAPAGSKGCGSNGCPSVSDLPLLVYIFRRNCIDRDAFLDLAYADWVEFIVRLHRDFASGKVRESVKVCEFCSVARFDALSARLLKIFGILTKVRDGWLGDARLGIPVPCAAPPDLSAPGILSQRSGPVPMDCSEGASQASERDGGVCFGRLVVLGHKEARHVAASGSGVTATPARFQPIGLCNETLELRRRYVTAILCAASAGLTNLYVCSVCLLFGVVSCSSVFAPGGPPRGLVLPHLGASSATAAAAAPSTSTNTNTNTSQKRSSLFSTRLTHGSRLRTQSDSSDPGLRCWWRVCCSTGQHAAQLF